MPCNNHTIPTNCPDPVQNCSCHCYPAPNCPCPPVSPACLCQEMAFNGTPVPAVYERINFVSGSGIAITTTTGVGNQLNVNIAATGTGGFVTAINKYQSGSDNGISYTTGSGTTNIKTGHTQVVNPIPNVAGTITHGLGTTRVIAMAYDVASGNSVDVVFSNRTLNSIDYVSTTANPIEIVIKS